MNFKLIAMLVFILGLNVVDLSAQEYPPRRVTAMEYPQWIPSKVTVLEYPSLPRAARIAGTISIKCNLIENGKVISAEVINVVEDPVQAGRPARDLLAKAAQENALEWVFARTVAWTGEMSAELTYTFGFQETVGASSLLRSIFTFESPNSVRVLAQTVMLVD
jgi:hypothetical protein